MLTKPANLIILYMTWCIHFLRINKPCEPSIVTMGSRHNILNAQLCGGGYFGMMLMKRIYLFLQKNKPHPYKAYIAILPSLFCARPHNYLSRYSTTIIIIRHTHRQAKLVNYKLF